MEKPPRIPSPPEQRIATGWGPKKEATLHDPARGVPSPAQLNMDDQLRELRRAAAESTVEAATALEWQLRRFAAAVRLMREMATAHLELLS